MKYSFLLIVSGILIFQSSLAQFIDQFDELPGSDQGKTPAGWTAASGDGEVSVEFVREKDHASFYVDATKDKRNIWWAIIRRQVPGLDLNRLSNPEYELRVEVRVKVSHAPRRINLHFNHQRTTDFHSHLMEYDIPDTTNWHTLSMTTENFDGRPGDKINVQLALMDWGKGEYRIDIEYFKVDVVNINEVGEDLGNKLP